MMLINLLVISENWVIMLKKNYTRLWTTTKGILSFKGNWRNLAKGYLNDQKKFAKFHLNEKISQYSYKVFIIFFFKEKTGLKEFYFDFLSIRDMKIFSHTHLQPAVQYYEFCDRWKQNQLLRRPSILNLKKYSLLWYIVSKNCLYTMYPKKSD